MLATATDSAAATIAPVAEQDWVAVVANPYSGAGQNKRIVGRLEEALRGQGLRSRVLWDLVERGQVLRDAPRLAGCRCVVIAGGDGTVAGVLNEMLGRDMRAEARTPAPVAVMPIGNENLFAKQFGYRRPERIAAAVARGRTMDIDLGEIGGGEATRLFTLMISAGFDAEVVHRVQQWRQAGGALRRARRWSYVRPTMRAVREYRYRRVTLRADGQEVSGCHAMVFNLPRYACGLKFVPNCQPNDGLLHWVVFEKRGLAALAGYLARVAMGRHTRCAGVRWGAAKEVEIIGAEDVPVQVDGDPGGLTPVRVGIRPHAARIVVM